MDIKFSEKDGVKYAKFIGNLDGNSSEKASGEVIENLNDDISLIIDMTECTYVSSAGLRALLLIGKNVKMKNGTMKFVNLCDEVTDIMEMTGFAGMFKSFGE